jgi:cell division protein FtsQ
MAKLNKKKQQRGASVRGGGRAKRSFNFNLRRFMPVLYTAMFFGVCFGLYQLAYPLLTKAVSRVSISGEFLHVDKSRLAKKVTPYLEKGFLLSDLSAIQQGLEEMPWVYQVSVERKWPDKIAIQVVEQTAIARWGSSAYINAEGDIFNPLKVENIVGLVMLSGPESRAQDVMLKFETLTSVFKQQGLNLKQLLLSDSYRWTAVLEGGVTLVLGPDPIMKKVERFMLAYQLELKSKFKQVARVDMRYSNGLAVQWQAAIKKQSSET